MAIATLSLRNPGIPEKLVLEEGKIYRGGEGNVYFTQDGLYAVKIYHNPSPDKEKLLTQILNLGKNLGEDGRFLAWPVGIVNRLNDQPRVGVVTRRVSDSHVPLYQLIYSPSIVLEQFQKGISWLNYLKMARGVAAAIRVIHGKGMAHADIHMKNFLAEPNSGEVVLIDLDGLVVQGFLPPQVKGMPGFIAPEVVMGKAKPGELSDRHSLAVLILWTLLFRNVMEPQMCYDPDDENRDNELAYGQYARFSEDPNDRRNWFAQIGQPFFRRGALSYRALTPKLQKLTEKALIDGLHNPNQRPQAIEWERGLAEAYDELVTCPNCRQSFIYPHWLLPPGRRRCPFCGAGMGPVYPVVARLLEQRIEGNYREVRRVVFYHRLPLFADQLIPGSLPPFTRRGTPAIGVVVWEQRLGAYFLINQDQAPWQVLRGEGKTVRHGEGVPLHPGTLISFGSGKRLLEVVEG